MAERITVIDTHTGGEPTRVIVAGGPELGSGTMAQRLAVFHERFDRYRSAVVNEPRGSDVMVGAILLPPQNAERAAGVIFFNNVGYLGMCGHGAIGVAVALDHLGKIGSGVHRLETPVGEVTIELEGKNTVAIENVVSYRIAKDVAVDVPGLRAYKGDIAWGGNWFFLVHDHGETLAADNIERLTDVSWRIRQTLEARGITGEGGALIDHIELFGPSGQGASGKSFVLCPGRAYDRSPCGTGTSAKLACLAADGALREGEIWRQESIIGSVFEGTVRLLNGGRVAPRIRGTAYVCGESTLIIDPADPFAWGIRS